VGKESEIKKKARFGFFRYPVSFTIIVFVILLIVFGIFTVNRSFFKYENLTAMGRLAPDLGIVALGVGTLMIAGEFDLSVASTIPVSSFVFTKLLGWGAPLIVMLLVTLFTGLLIGFFNGILVVRTKLPSFIITLGTMLFWRGLVYAASRMMPIGIRAWLEQGSWIEKLFIGKIGGVFPVQTLWFFFFAIFLGMLVHFHRFGNWIFVTGDNEIAARAMGINTAMVKVVCYMIVGVLCSFMGMIQNLRIESFAANQGVGYELKAIASAVVGGTSLMGGIGSIPGIFLGTLTIQIIENGLILMGAPAFGISAFIGAAIILFAVLNVSISRVTGR
jgi:simple sugar transport system permease protein